jgi:hypothetical protein
MEDLKVRLSLSALLCLLAGLASCRGSAATGMQIDPPVTGLVGTMLRGPVMPVCRPTVPCDAPFAASFVAQQDQRTVATFQSDSLGQFLVGLSPGTYLIVPGPNAPIISPGSQTREVTVGPVGLTKVQLEFDTGIR